MNARSRLGAAALAAGLVVLALLPGAGATSRRGLGAFWTSAQLRHRAQTLDSANWSGYDVGGSNITAVYTTFRVPSVRGFQPGFSATWAGIGGVGGHNDLIQAGIEQDNEFGGNYYAWWELLPAPETAITGGCTGDANCSVRPGDVVSVDIHVINPSAQTWSINLQDVGHWSFTKTVQYQSSMSSADWVFEAVSYGILVGAPLVVPQTDMIPFGPLAKAPVMGNQFSIGGQKPRVLASGHPDTIDLNAGYVVPEGTPSAIASDGNGFNACSYALSCPRPAS